MFVRLGFTEFLPVFFSFLGVADETEGRPPGFTEFRSVLPSFHVLKRRFIASQCFKPCFTDFYRVFFCYHLQEDGTAYNASFLSTWLVTTWTLLFLPLYAAGRLLLAAAGVGGVASGAA